MMYIRPHIMFRKLFPLNPGPEKNILNDPMITKIGLQKEMHFWDSMDLAAILDAM